MQLEISNVKVGENESGLLHWAEADFTTQGEVTRVRTYFIDMPMITDVGELDMSGVGSLLLQAYQDTLRPPPEPQRAPEGAEKEIEDEPSSEFPETEPVAISPTLLAKRRSKLTALTRACKKIKPVSITIENIGDSREDIGEKR